MKIKAPLLFLLILLNSIVFQGFSQDNKITKQEKKEWGVQQITKLKNGVLLVRIHTRDVSANALIKMGKEEAAQKVLDDQKARNLALVNAFRVHFDFCPVYFFYSDQSKGVRLHQWEEVDFLNDSLEEDETISIQPDTFLIAEVALLEQDTTAFFDDYALVVGENGYERRAVYYGGPEQGFQALVIKNDKFHQLSDPFPYYVRSFDSLPVNRKEASMVMKLQEKLDEYYSRVGP